MITRDQWGQRITPTTAKPTPLAERIPSLRTMEASLVDARVYQYSQHRERLEGEGHCAINCFTGYVSDARDHVERMAEVGEVPRTDADRLVAYLWEAVR